MLQRPKLHGRRIETTFRDAEKGQKERQDQETISRALPPGFTLYIDLSKLDSPSYHPLAFPIFYTSLRSSGFEDEHGCAPFRDFAFQTVSGHSLCGLSI